MCIYIQCIYTSRLFLFIVYTYMDSVLLLPNISPIFSNSRTLEKQNSKSVTSCTIFFYNTGHEQRRRQSRYRGRRA